MDLLIDPDDIEPLDASERCDQVYGNYWIGREDESRDELALFLDVPWLPQPDFLERSLWPIVNRYDGRLLALAEYAPDERSDAWFREQLHANLHCVRSCNQLPNSDTMVVVVELAHHTVRLVDTALRAYTAYLGFGNISWPSNFRSAVMQRVNYL